MIRLVTFNKLRKKLQNSVTIKPIYSFLKWKLKHVTELQKQKGLKCGKWSEVKGIWSARKSSIYGQKCRKLFSEVKWRDFEVRGKSIISKNRSEVKGIWSGTKIS